MRMRQIYKTAGFEGLIFNLDFCCLHCVFYNSHIAEWSVMQTLDSSVMKTNQTDRRELWLCNDCGKLPSLFGWHINIYYDFFFMLFFYQQQNLRDAVNYPVVQILLYLRIGWGIDLCLNRYGFNRICNVFHKRLLIVLGIADIQSCVSELPSYNVLFHEIVF